MSLFVINFNSLLQFYLKSRIIFRPEGIGTSTNVNTISTSDYITIHSILSIFSSPKKTTTWVLNITFESVTIHNAGELTIPSAFKQWNSFTVVLTCGRFVHLFDYNHWIKEIRFKATLLKIRQLSVPDYTKYKGYLRRQELPAKFSKIRYPRLTFLDDFLSDVTNEPTKKMVKASRRNNRNIFCYFSVIQWLKS